MDVTLGLLANSPSDDGGGGGGGCGVPSGGSTTEVTSAYPVVIDENLDDLELGLGLSIGCSGGGLKSKTVAGGGWNQHARILTAKDFPTSLVSKPNSCSSSSIDSVSPPNGTSVVGWPPVSKAHRIPNLANQNKSPTENIISITEQNKRKNRTVGIKDYSNDRNLNSNKKFQSVKVNMDGTLIGRKVDLNAHTSYETLAKTLEEMFWGNRTESTRLLDGTSEFVLTYEDKDGDCMLVGDVPWEMFLNSVKRLRIMKKSESNVFSTDF